MFGSFTVLRLPVPCENLWAGCPYQVITSPFLRIESNNLTRHYIGLGLNKGRRRGHLGARDRVRVQDGLLPGASLQEDALQGLGAPHQNRAQVIA